jgi:hypothetical protein
MEERPITCISIYIYISSNSLTISSIYFHRHALEYALKGFKWPYEPC